jgi:phage/plasmid-associated DNA primase
MDALGDFIREKCVVDPEAEETPAELYRAYREWAEAAGERAMSRHALGRRLEERGFQPGRTGRKGRFWSGVRLRTPTDSEPDGDASPAVTHWDAFFSSDTPNARAVGISGEKRHQASPPPEASPDQEVVEL